MNSTVTQHKSEAPEHLGCAVITISDTRTLDDDRGGSLVQELLQASGHAVLERCIVKDEPAAIRFRVESLARDERVQAILLTGGTGIGRRDWTFETVSGMLTKPLPGYGELFRALSYQEIGAAAMLSRTVGGLLGETVVLTMPGSPAAVRLALEKLILPELGHLVREATK